MLSAHDLAHMTCLQCVLERAGWLARPNPPLAESEWLGHSTKTQLRPQSPTDSTKCCSALANSHVGSAKELCRPPRALRARPTRIQSGPNAIRSQPIVLKCIFAGSNRGAIWGAEVAPRERRAIFSPRAREKERRGEVGGRRVEREHGDRTRLQWNRTPRPSV